MKKYVWGFMLSVILGLGACRQEQAKPQEQHAALRPLRSCVSGEILFQADWDGDWEIYTINADGSHILQLTENTANDSHPTWSPDGQFIAFKSNREGNFDIYIMHADGTSPRNLTKHPSLDQDPAWSPDGKQIAFSSDREDGDELFFINTDGTRITQLTDTIGKNGLVAWSPQGNDLAYTGKRYLGWSIYVLQLPNRKEWRRAIGCHPAWSPDGKQLAYVVEEFQKKTDIWLMQADGTQQRRLTIDTLADDYFPAWSPDGQAIVYAKTTDHQHTQWDLYIISPDGQQQFQLTDHVGNEMYPDWID